MVERRKIGAPRIAGLFDGTQGLRWNSVLDPNLRPRLDSGSTVCWRDASRGENLVFIEDQEEDLESKKNK